MTLKARAQQNETIVKRINVSAITVKYTVFSIVEKH